MFLSQIVPAALGLLDAARAELKDGEKQTRRHTRAGPKADATWKRNFAAVQNARDMIAQADRLLAAYQKGFEDEQSR